MFKIINEKIEQHNVCDKANERINDNVAIIEEVTRGDYANAKRFSGMGGLAAQIKNKPIREALLKTIGQKRLSQLEKSTTSGYFTPPEIIKTVYDIISQLGFTEGRILEPSCGVGGFIEHMPSKMRQNSQITAVELEPLSARITKTLYDDIEVLNQGFENFNKKNFDLIIGNPPYGSECLYDKQHKDLDGQAIHHYFVAKSIRLLKTGGLLAMVVPCYVLDNVKRHARCKIAKQANLVCAYRLPDALFSNAKITIDIVIFQKTDNPSNTDDWVESVPIELEKGYRCHLSQYYTQNADHILGKLDSYEFWLACEQRMRRGLKCTGTLTEALVKLDKLILQLVPLNVLPVRLSDVNHLLLALRIRHASDVVLTSGFPEAMTVSQYSPEIGCYIDEHVSQLFEDWPKSDIYQHIIDIAKAMRQHFHMLAQ